MLRAKDVVTEDDLAFLLALYDDPGFDQLTEIQFAAWGTRIADDVAFRSIHCEA